MVVFSWIGMFAVALAIVLGGIALIAGALDFADRVRAFNGGKKMSARIVELEAEIELLKSAGPYRSEPSGCAAPK